MRYPHYLRPAKGGVWPRRVVCVAVGWQTDQALDGGTRAQEVLDGWSAVSLSLREDRYEHTDSITGRTVEAWWRYLAAQLSHGHTVWIMSPDCGRAWTLLDLWSALEDQRCYVIGTDPYEEADARQRTVDIRRGQAEPLRPISSGQYHRSQERRHGLLVVQNPPCVATLRMADYAARIHWVDARNYSVEITQIPARPGETALRVGAWWLEYHQLCATLGLGSAQHTIGSQALHGWRCSYWMPRVYVGGTGPLTDLESAAYYGGRCEMFRAGHSDQLGYHVDMRSAYASVMACHDLPVRPLRRYESPSVRDAHAMVTDHACTALVQISTDQPAYPCRRSGDTVWPVGAFKTALAHPELDRALAYGHVHRVYQLVTYETAPVLERYATEIYARRVSADTAEETHISRMCKALLCSIVGKFGQRARHWRHMPDHMPVALWGEWWGSDDIGRPARYRSLGGCVQRDVIGDLGDEAVPSIAAYITSEIRMRLWRLICCAGREHVWYCDTDSLILDATGYTALERAGHIQHGQLGALELRGGPCTYEIRGVKYYVEDGRVVCSGMPRGECVDYGDGIHYWYTPGVSTHCYRGQRPSATSELREYQRTEPYRHGVVMSDGSVQPIVIQE